MLFIKTFTKKLLLSTCVIALVYGIAIVYIMNLSLINTVITGNTPVLFKLTLLAVLLRGFPQTMTQLSLVLFLMNAVLTGLILAVTWQKLQTLKKMGNVHLVVCGSSLLGLVSGGCVSCGLPLLSLLGLGGSLVYLPFKGAELPFISIALLSVSLFWILRQSAKEEYCAVPERKK